MFVFPKTPQEIITDVGIDFTNRFPDGTELLTCTVTCATTGIVQGARISGMEVLADLAGGTAGVDYEITYTATGNNGSTRDGFITLKVR